MKKILCSVVLAGLILLGTMNCMAAEQDTYLIYRNQNFEDHNIGDLPNAFVYHGYDTDGFYYNEATRIAGYENTEVVNLPKDGNSNNKAVKISADDDYTTTSGRDKGTARSVFTYYPMKEKGVISFAFMVEDATEHNVVRIGRNAIDYRHITYVDNKDPKNGDTRYIKSNWEPFISVSGGKIYYYTGNSNIAFGTVQNNTWYDIDFTFDIATESGTVYFNGTPTAVSLPANTVNIYEVRFDLPSAGNDAWYIDDLRIYEADGIVADQMLDSQWADYTDSSFYTGYEFVSSRAANYDYMAFLKCNNKRFNVINTSNLFDGRNVVHMGAPVQYNDEGILIVPVYDMAKALGATVASNDADGGVTVTYGSRTMQVIPGKTIYYIDGKTAKMLCPASYVDDVVCVQIDALLGFFGEDYILQDDILWIDEPEDFDWHMPVDVNGNELSGTSAFSLEENIYKRILHMLLYDRPTGAEIDAAMRNVHPRIEFTEETVTEIKERINPESENYDGELAKAIGKIKTQADNMLNPDHEDYAVDVEYGLYDGVRPGYCSTIYNYFNPWAFAYLVSDSPEDKATYKNAILHHLTYLNDTELFPDFHIYEHSGLSTGTMAYGLAYAIDWVDWTEKELEMIENMCRRNILDHALHSYVCTLNYHNHNFSYNEGNQALITNGGMLLLASALYDRDPEYYQDIIRGALRATEGGTISYFPNGEYIEGISYWRYAGGFLPCVLKGMQTSMGSDWGITDVPGVLETAEFPFMLKGAIKDYAFGDGREEQPFSSLMMFVADQTNNKALAQYRKKNGGVNDPTTVDIANWVYDTGSYNLGLDAVYDEDIYSKMNETVVMKTGWNESDTSVAFHGGANNDGHGHIDIGAFQFDMNGVRFGIDIVREDYNLRSIGHYNETTAQKIYGDTELWPNGYPYTSGHYYRTKGEGHNTVVANRSVINSKEPTDSDSYDMNTTATSEFTNMEFGDDESFAILDMTQTNDIFDCAIRGVKLDKVNNIIYIQDDFAASSETDFLWSMHTKATIEIYEDGKTAVLTSGSQKIKVTLLNDNGCGFKFEELAAEFDTTYGTSLKPPLETPNTPCSGSTCTTHAGKCSSTDHYRKLAVRTLVDKDITRFKLAVAIEPYVEGAETAAKYVSIERWKSN